MNKDWKIRAREILDSRGNPTVEAQIDLPDGRRILAGIPSGASTGAHEARELRDGDKARFNGRGALKACHAIEREISPALNGMDLREQRAVDKLLIELDGTPNKSRLGANAVLAVSIAAAKAGALLSGKPLYRHLADVFGTKSLKIPVPMLNVINGGRHAANGLNIQEFMIVPGAPAFKDGLREACEVFAQLREILKERKDSTSVGDEGGFAPLKCDDPSDAMGMIIEAIRRAGYAGRTKLALDLAATEFFDNGRYRLYKNRKTLNSAGVARELLAWTRRFPIVSIEDPLAEDDWVGWKNLTGTFRSSSVLVVGDDLFVTNSKRLERGVKEGAANSILIKPNQIGTLTETAEVVAMARAKGYATIASHRSGETEDASLSHIAVGLGADGIKTGSVTRSERLAKYNELLRLEEELGPGKYRKSLVRRGTVAALARA